MMVLLPMSIGRTFAGHAHAIFAWGEAQMRDYQFSLCEYPMPIAVEHSVVFSDVLPQEK